MNYLVTGITGTLGQAVTKLILEKSTNRVLGVSRDEQKQRLIPSHPRLSLALGDVRDRERMTELGTGIDVIFHFAALKCVDTIEFNPNEALKTNVLGTNSMMHSQWINKVPRVVLASTDKAAFPVNAYGNTKALAERLVLSDHRNVVCRYGNVIASRGSVIPAFVKSLKETKSVSITDSQMTRFFIKIQDAAKFVFDSAHGIDSGLMIPQMRATTILEVADAVAELLGIKGYKVNFVGVRPGEKIHECLRMPHEGKEVHSNTAPQFSRDELLGLLHDVVRSS